MIRAEEGVFLDGSHKRPARTFFGGVYPIIRRCCHAISVTARGPALNRAEPGPTNFQGPGTVVNGSCPGYSVGTRLESTLNRRSVVICLLAVSLLCACKREEGRTKVISGAPL